MTRGASGICIVAGEIPQQHQAVRVQIQLTTASSRYYSIQFQIFNIFTNLMHCGIPVSQAHTIKTHHAHAHAGQVSDAALEQLSTKSSHTLATLARTESVSVSSDGTCKLLLRLADGLAVESVLIPPLLVSEFDSSHARPDPTTRALQTRICDEFAKVCVQGGLIILQLG